MAIRTLLAIKIKHKLWMEYQKVFIFRLNSVLKPLKLDHKSIQESSNN